VKETVKREHLLSPGDQLIVALSGGADSCALLSCLLILEQELGISLVACHVNHLLRGEEAEEDEAAVKALCKAWGVPLRCFRRDVGALAKEQGMGEEECGRQERYACFEALAGELEREGGAPVKIATAHTGNDNAETLLLHVVRGCGLAGLRGIPYRRGRVVRPLLDCTRLQVEEYCRDRGIAWREDSTNASTRYARNALRLEVLPRLEKLNPAFLDSAARLGRIARREEEFLAGESLRALAECRAGEGLALAGLQGLHPALRLRVLALWVAEQGGEAETEALERLEALVMQGRGRMQWDGALRFLLCGGRITRERAEEPPFSLVLRPGENRLPWGDVIFFGQEGENFGKMLPRGFFFQVDCDKIEGSIVARQRRAGDRFSPAGRGVTKTLKKIFNEAKIEPYNRGRIPVLEDDAGIIAVLGFGPDARVAAGPQTKRAACLCFLRHFGEG
jgi:tRNA(Ile)-lysidine synthase